MITFTHCAFMAKQACATCSKVVQKITPPIANNFLKFFFTLFAILTLNAATAWAEEVTYVFTSKEWAAKIGSTAANWTSNKAGAGFSNNGIQVTTAATGANGTSPISYDNISQIVVTYNTNTSKGKGTLSVKIGDNAVTTNNWQYSGSANGTSANFTSTFDYSSPQSGKVTLTANTTTNSIYVVSIKIVTSAGTEPPTPANPYKVTLEAGPGTCAESVTEASAGAGVTLPTPTLDCGDWEFVGWTTSSVTTKTTSKPEILLTGTYSPSTDITLYAVYKRTETTEGAGTTEVTKTVSISDYASAKSWINDNRYTTVNIDANITATASSDPATNTGKYYSNDNSWRFYQNEKGKLTITANEGITLKSITLTFTNKDSGTISYNSNSCTSNTAISVSGQSATFTVGSSSGSKGKILITKISVTYESTSGGASTTYYHSTPECAAPCADVVTIRKGTSDNGSFKLDKTGEQSTCNGAVTVTLSDIQPAAGYKFSEITQSEINTGVTIDNNNQKVTYAKNTTGTSTINVVFIPIEYTLALESTLSCVTNGSATIAYNATSAKNFTAATRDDYTCTGYWSAPSGGVQVLKADGTFVGDVSGFISGGKWVNTTATKLTPRWETEYKMILSKGTEENGTYTLSPTNIETSGCATSTTRQVTITATPVAGYEVDQITYSGEGIATMKTGPTISAGKTTWVYTFAENDKGTGTFTVTFKQLPKYTVTWMANEQLHADQTSVVGTSLTNPGDPEASTYACDDKVFVGWTAAKNYSNTTTAPDDLFKSAEATSKTIPENGITYYAVFANATTIPGTTTTTEETATLSFADAAQRVSFSSTQQVWKQNGIVFTNNQAESSNEVADYVNPVRCYKSSDIIIDCNDLGNITKVQFKCTTSEYANNLKNSIGSEASTTTTWVTLIPKTETKVYEISLSSGQTRISSLIVTYEKTIVNDPTVTYSKYSTTCEATPDVELQSIEISGDLTKKTYTAGDDLDFSGLSVNAKYSDGTSQNVTTKVEWSDVTLTVGQTSVTLIATYEGKTDDITITGLTVSSPATPEPEGEWVLTSLADITCSDLVVITMKNSNGTYALTNGNGTSDAPKATEVEIANDKLKTEPSEILQWVVMNNNGELTIYPVNDYNRWLYCFNHNNGVRVGDNQNNVFTIDDETGYLYHVYEKRYLGVYNSSDWRCYETVNNNIKEQTLAFFVKKDANPNPCEKPVDDGINPVATFIFNTAEGLEKLGITNVESSLNISEGREFIQEGVTMTNVKNNSSTSTRVWLTTSGSYDLRMYKKAVFKLSVPQGHNIRKVVFEGDNIKYLTADNGEFNQKVWTGKQQEVVFTIADDAETVKIYTISVAVDYTRNVTKDEYGTICIPYGSNNYTGAEFYEISWMEMDGTTPKGIWLDEVNGNLTAGKPYIFKATSTVLTVNCTGTAVANPATGEAGLVGTFKDIKSDNTILEGNYMISGNQFLLCPAGCWLNANRAYIDATIIANHTTKKAKIPGRRRVCLGETSENEATGFENIVAPEGQAVKAIVNGQLIIIRDGVKYNVQGQKL